MQEHGPASMVPDGGVQSTPTAGQAELHTGDTEGKGWFSSATFCGA